MIHVKLKSWLRHVGPTVSYLNINLISYFLRYSWLARPALHVLQCMTWLVEVGRYRKVIPPVDDISTVFSKTVRQPASSLPNVHYRWTLGARQAINHVFSDAGKMSRDVNIPFRRFNCRWWVKWGHVRQTVLNTEGFQACQESEGSASHPETAYLETFHTNHQVLFLETGPFAAHV